MSKVTIIQIDIKDLREALLQLDKSPTIEQVTIRPIFHSDVINKQLAQEFKERADSLKFSPDVHKIVKLMRDKGDGPEADFTANQTKPDAKPRASYVTNERKAEIMELAGSGLSNREIADRLSMNRNTVKDIRYRMSKKAPKPPIAEVKPVEVELPKEPVESPSIKVIADLCATCGKLAGQDRVAIEGKIYCKQCAPSKPPLIKARYHEAKPIDERLLTLVAGHTTDTAKDVAKALEAFGYNGLSPLTISYYRGLITKRKKADSKVKSISSDRQAEIDVIIKSGIERGHKYSNIAAKIGRTIGGAWTSDHVAERVKEMKRQ